MKRVFANLQTVLFDKLFNPYTTRIYVLDELHNRLRSYGTLEAIIADGAHDEILQHRCKIEKGESDGHR